ncbi:PIG-L deacetylase family protein [Natronobacterium texcoconense]|uniref:Bacillithiol biosynthesis deacetylase BshB1 n=1 Tax=Natronobacterium texcoconense TaxID=1095778 RepID=A0A1H1FUY9_NATTX|nr:PIG-L family deacetylase [Natronobacterium texcoconense]SDR04774.1 bacillithiol biosynthesis deacetylase BshB1 [Natronobacterium texcoconense]
MRILALVAHPDDADIFCGGTLARHADRGDDVTIAHLTAGEYGGFDATEAEVAATRREEARRSAETLGCDCTFLEFEDGRVQNTLENRLEIVDVIREYEPELIVTHHDDDMHPDHRETSKLVTDAYYMASLPMVETEHAPHDPENVYFFGKPTAEFEPDVYVDVSDYQDRKEEAILHHESQVEFLEEHGGIDAEFDDLIENVRARARTQGTTAGVEFAEGFSRHHEVADDGLR